MNRELSQVDEGLGLLANGSSGLWDVSVDESLDGRDWFLEIDGPQTYLIFQLRDLAVIPKALRLLRSWPGSNTTKGQHDAEGDNTLPLGWFGSFAVSLLWDNEDFPRCFIIVGPQARSTLCLSLEAEDIRMVSDALEQVL